MSTDPEAMALITSVPEVNLTNSMLFPPRPFALSSSIFAFHGPYTSWNPTVTSAACAAPAMPISAAEAAIAAFLRFVFMVGVSSGLPIRRDMATSRKRDSALLAFPSKPRLRRLERNRSKPRALSRLHFCRHARDSRMSQRIGVHGLPLLPRKRVPPIWRPSLQYWRGREATDRVRCARHHVAASVAAAKRRSRVALAGRPPCAHTVGRKALRGRCDEGRAWSAGTGGQVVRQPPMSSGREVAGSHGSLARGPS